MPAGAKEAPLAWWIETVVERTAHFDRDEQAEVVVERTVVIGFREVPDPRIARAGALSLHGLERVPLGFWDRFPGEAVLGAGITALTVEAHTLVPDALRTIGARRRWRDLSVWGARWGAMRRAGIGELAASFPELLGLELHSAPIDAADLATLAAASFVPRLEDLTVTGAALPPHEAARLVEGLGPLVHLDLRDARLPASVLAPLGPKLRGARRIVLSGNALGDEGLASLARDGALAAVEDLWLSSCGLTDRSLALLGELAPPALRGLWLDGNAFGDDALSAFVETQTFERLDGASLGTRGPLERARARLRAHPLAACLDGTARRPGVVALWFQGRITAR